MWKEKQIPKGAQTPVAIWRIRFEKADLAEPSWWIPKGQAPTEADISAGLSLKTPVETCSTCGISSKEIFTAGWFCLNNKCKNYYVFPTGKSVDLVGLTYTSTFLNQRTLFIGKIPSVTPPIPSHEGLHGTELAVRRGFVCPDCGSCNRRIYWNNWVCENPNCQFIREAPMRPYPAENLDKENERFDKLMVKRREHWGVNYNPLKNADRIHDPLASHYNRGLLPYSQTLTEGGHLIRQYFLNDAAGKILGSFSIFSSTETINAQPGGPDELFRSLELIDIGLRRNPAAVAGRKYYVVSEINKEATLTDI